MAKNNVPISKITFHPGPVEGRLWFDKLTTNGLREIIFSRILKQLWNQASELQSDLFLMDCDSFLKESVH